MSPLNGSATIYNNILLPLFNRNQSKVDNVLNKGKSLADQGISEAVKIASEVESKKSEWYEKFCVPKVKRLLCHTSYLRLNLLICWKKENSLWKFIVVILIESIAKCIGLPDL